MGTLEKLSQDICKIIEAYNKLERDSHINNTVKERRIDYASKLRNLSEFSERYLGYKITVDIDRNKGVMSGYRIETVKEEDR